MHAGRKAFIHPENMFYKYICLESWVCLVARGNGKFIKEECFGVDGEIQGRNGE